MRLSHIHEDKEVHDGYHCTSVDNAEDIKNNGFKSFPQDLRGLQNVLPVTGDNDDEIMQELLDMLNRDSVTKPLLDQFWSNTKALNNVEWLRSLYKAGDYETENRLADELYDIQNSLATIWLNEFKDGTFIWLSDRIAGTTMDSGQEKHYGDACFGVTLPDTAVLLFDAPVDKSHYSLYFAPTRIPSQNFKLA